MSNKKEELTGLDKKLQRAGEILKLSYAVMHVKDDKTNSHFLVRSQSDSQKVYSVTLYREHKNQKHTCTCINWKVNEVYDAKYKCKHIISLLAALNTKRRIPDVDPSEFL
jgi:predicted nucleic acid-binding Zn finger protein